MLCFIVILMICGNSLYNRVFSKTSCSIDGVRARDQNRFSLHTKNTASYPADTASSPSLGNDYRLRRQTPLKVKVKVSINGSRHHPLATRCSVDQWTCNNGSCIPFDGKCDGVVQCADGSDEIHAYCRSMRCAPNLFRCMYGACVDGSATCNGVADCADGSDELLPWCPNQTLQMTSTFTCKNGEQISVEDMCDGTKTCADGSDETLGACAGRSCAPYQFQCAYGACVNADAACDAYGKDHCVDGSDEASELCDNDEYRPSKQCYLPEQPANGIYSVSGINNTRPGQGFKTAILLIKCNDTYSIDGRTWQIFAYCLNGYWYNSMPECKKFCTLPSHDNVTYTCLLRGNNILRDIERSCSKYEPSGTHVYPRCNDGYHQDLSIMRCVDGVWDHEVKCTEGKHRDICGVHGGGQPIMIGGTNARADEVPWHAGIYNKSKEYEQICGGSLVTRQVVISAAHCFWGGYKVKNHSYYAVALGQLNKGWKNGDGQWFNVTLIKVPGTFAGVTTNWQSDIALVFLDKLAEYKHNVQPICLELDDRGFDEMQIASGKLGKIAGWGLVSEDGEAAEELKVNQLPVVDSETCIKNSDLTFPKALCRGDSGGGLVFRDGTDQPYYLRGVASIRPTNSTNFKRCNAIGYTTFTKVFTYATFIKDNINNIIGN